MAIDPLQLWLQASKLNASTGVSTQAYAAFNNPRVHLIRDILIRALTNNGQNQLTRSELDLIDMGVSLIVEQGIVPGAYSGGKQYADILGGIQQVTNTRSLSLDPSYTASQEDLAVAALNAQGVINDVIYNNDATFNYSVTKGLSAELASTSSARILKDVLTSQQQLGIQSFDQIEFGGSAYSMNQAIQSAIQTGNFRHGGTIHNRLVQQQQEIEHLEAASLLHLVQNQDYKVPNELKNITTIEGAKAFIRRNQGRYNIEYTDGEGNKYSVSNNDILRAYLEESDVKQSIAHGTDVKGKIISNEAYNRATQQAIAGNSYEMMLSADARKQTETTIAKASSNIQFLSKIYGTEDFNTLQTIANDLNIGSLTQESNINNVKSQIRQALNVAVQTGKDIKYILQERADLIKALAPDAGGTEFVSSQFVSNVQVLRYNNITDFQGSTLRTSEESIAAVQRSMSNAINNFGGIALAKYALDTQGFLPEKQRSEVQNLITQAEEALRSGDRDTARNIASILSDRFSSMSYSHTRIAYKKYSNDLYENSVRTGLQAQMVQDFNERLQNGTIQPFIEEGSQLDQQQRVEKANQIINDAIYLAGSDQKALTSIFSDYKKYIGAIQKGEDKEKVKTSIRDSLTQRGYSKKDIDTYIGILTSAEEAGIDMTDMSSWLRYQISNTETIALGREHKAKEWKSFFEQMEQKKDRSLGGAGIGELIIAGIYGDGSQNIDAQEALELEYARYKSELDSGQQGSIEEFINRADDKVTAAYLGIVDSNGNFVDEQGRVQNNTVLDRLLKNDEFKKLINWDQLSPEQQETFKDNFSKEGARYLKEYADANNLTIGSLAGEWFITDSDEYENRSIDINKQMEAIRNLDLQQFVQEKRDENGEITEKKGYINNTEFDQILKQLYGIPEGADEDQVRSELNKHMDSTGRFLKGSLFEGKTYAEARDLLNRVSGNGSTFAEQLNEYKQQITAISENTITQQTQALLQPLNSIYKWLCEFKQPESLPPSTSR